jgi:hypothetical protein
LEKNFKANEKLKNKDEQIIAALKNKSYTSISDDDYPTKSSFAAFDFWDISDKLRRELKEHGRINSDRKWDQIQVSFFQKHKYFTKSSIQLRQEKKDQHLKEIIARLERDEYED